MKPKAAKNALRKSIHELNNCRQHFTKNPKKDFTRNRKLSFEKMIQAILCMRDGSISNEMMDIFGFREDLATTSAFVQQRAKILPEAFELLFERFTKRASETKTYKSFQLLAADGSDVLSAPNPDDPDTYFPGTKHQKPFNMFHLNALYDLNRHMYVDAILQKKRCGGECDALACLIDRSPLKNVLLLCDRGYESYNIFAHLQEKRWKYLIRIRDGAGGMVRGFDLPDEPFFDCCFSLNLTNRVTNEIQRLRKDRNHYRYLSQTSRFDFLPKQSKKHDPIVFIKFNFGLSGSRFREIPLKLLSPTWTLISSRRQN